MDQVYYGEETCQGVYKSGKNKGLPCSNKAYYLCENGYMCGQHASDDGSKLDKNPDKKKNLKKEISQNLDRVEEVMEINYGNGLLGDIQLGKIRMMKPIPFRDGYLNILPNFKHGNRKDGIGLPSLSPMSLGPVEGVTNLENYHQGAKIFPGKSILKDE